MSQTKLYPERRILVIDDDPSIRTSLRRLLEHEGYSVFVASDGEEGLEVLKESQSQVVICDQDMPGMSGIEFLRLIRERYPAVCRIMLTGSDDIAVAASSVNDGAVYRFLQKPWDSVTMRVTVHFAFETLLVEEQVRRLGLALRRQVAIVRDLEKRFPGVIMGAVDGDAALLCLELEKAEFMVGEPLSLPKKP